MTTEDGVREKIASYVGKALSAASLKARFSARNGINETINRNAARGNLLSGAIVHEIAQIHTEKINTILQAKADALLDAYELYGAGANDEILLAVKSTREVLIEELADQRETGLPPGVPTSERLRPMVDLNTIVTINTISCQIEQRKVAPKFSRKSSDRVFQELAIEEARQSVAEDEKGRPKVGAVVVRNGRVLSQAHRGEKRGCHAEYVALEIKLRDESLAGATVYTTLEPCTTRAEDKIPCAKRLIERRVERVFIGILDPNPEIRGLGMRALNEAGIETPLFPLELQKQIEDINREFIRLHKDSPLRPRTAAMPIPLPTPVVQQAPADLELAEIEKYKGKIVTVFNRQKYGNGYLEGFWPNGAIIRECTPVWVKLEEPSTGSVITFPRSDVKAGFDDRNNRLQLTVYR